MTPWQEVDPEIFKRIFDYFWTDNPNNVLEIQNITNRDIRAFIGTIQNVNPLKWKNSNIEILEGIVKKLNMKAENYLKLCRIGFCLLERGPRIVPFGSALDHYNDVLNHIFDYSSEKDERSPHQYFWYTHDESGNIIKPKLPPPSDRIYRVRTYQVDEWESIINIYIFKNYIFPEELKTDDIKIY